MLTNEEITAIAGCFAPKKVVAAKKGMEHDTVADVDVTVRFRGTSSKAEKPEDRSSAARFPWADALAMACKGSGVTEQAIIDKIFECGYEIVAEDIRLDAQGLTPRQRKIVNKKRQQLRKDSGIAARVAGHKQRLATEMPKEDYEGRVTVAIMAEVLSGALVDPAAVSEVVDEVIEDSIEMADEVAT
jgi:hypothetical protein